MRRSATQINLWRECKRKFAFQYIASIRSPQTPSQALGDEVDSGQLQPFLRDGRPLDFTKESGYIAAAGLEYLPPPKWRGLEVQKELSLPSPSGRFGYLGYLDLWLPFGGLPQYTDNLVTVSDFKTTKSIKKWAKTEDALKTDVQANLYATWGMYTTKAREIRLRWLYFQTEGAKKAQPTDIVVDAKHIFEQFQAIDASANAIQDLLDSVPEDLDQAGREAFALTLEPNTEACDSFGGCPHRHRCNLSPAQFADSFFPTSQGVPLNTTSLLANLRSRKAQAAATPTQASEEAVPECLTRDYIPVTAQGARILGINPPEKGLPAPTPAPEAPAPPTQAEAAPAAPKRRGRPPKAAATPPPEPPTPPPESIEPPSVVVQVEPVIPIVQTAPVPAEANPADEGTTFEITWGEECYQPANFHSFRVGPFTAKGAVKPGESRADAMRRVANDLHLFAVEERANKADSFKRAAGIK